MDLEVSLDEEVEQSRSPPIANGMGNRRDEGSSSRGIGTGDTTRAQPVHAEPDPIRSIWNTVSKSVQGDSRAQNQRTENRENREREPTIGLQRRAFIDRQDNAHRVSPISQTAESMGRQENNDSDHDSDNGDDASDSNFTRDDRSIDVNRKRAQKPEQPQSKRPRLGNANENGQRASLSVEIINEPPSRAHQEGSVRHREATTRQDTGSPRQTPVPPEEPRQQQREEDSNTRRHFPWERRPRSPVSIPQTGWLSSASEGKLQQRWTEEETERLVKLIEFFGPQWAKIKRQDELCPRKEGGSKLGRRSQVQLKDRARNLLMTYLR